MRYSSIPSAHSVVQHCKARGIKNIVISPGSRNAPLTLGFTGDPFFNCYSIVDERCAAFFALGMAQQLREGVAVICTSGSALLNYYPAVAEAFYSNIPLLVISADRPPYKIDIGDGQTIRQEGVFHRHILRTASLRQDVVHATQAIRAAGVILPTDISGLGKMQEEVQHYNDSLLNRALHWHSSALGPVHINVPLEEPLYGLLEKAQVDPHIENYPVTDPGELEGLGEIGPLWVKSVRKMVIIGASYPGAVEEDYLHLLAQDPSVLVFTETTSNCHHHEFFPSIDSIVAPIEKSVDHIERFKALQPEILLTFGGMVVSKKIKAFLRQYRPKHHWHIGSGEANDTYYSLSRHFKTTPNQFFGCFKQYMGGTPGNYRDYWKKIRSRYREMRDTYLAQIPFTDMQAFNRILASIPHGYQVQLANSSTVRYTQLFDMHPSLRVFCNRGASGIDGSTSTAMGAAFFDEQPTVFITGDLSFFYDSNALWSEYLRHDFRVVVINNQGGGIFRILPGMEESKNYETYFETVQDLNIGKLCDFFGIGHQVVSGEKDLAEALSDFYKPSGAAKLLEVQTPRLVNNKILLAYFDFLS